MTTLEIVQAVVLAVSTLAVGVLAAWSKYKQDRSAEKKGEAEAETIEIRNHEILLNAIVAERKQDAMERKKEQTWLNEQFKETANRWQMQYQKLSDEMYKLMQYQKLSDEMHKLMQDHIKCREENAVMKSQIEDLKERLDTLEHSTRIGKGDGT